MNGTLVALEPEKAGAPVVAEGSGRAVVASGLRMLDYVSKACCFKGKWELDILINNVNHAVSNKDVRHNYFSCVDEYRAIHDGNGHVIALHCLKTSVVF